MEKKGIKTVRNEPGQAWDMIWNELRRTGIFKGQGGPVEGSIQWGENASMAIQRLQEAKLQAAEVDNIGMLLQAAIHVEGIRNALKANGGKPPTGTDIKNGFEQIRNFTLGGLVPPLEITPTDHEGGGWVQVFQVKGGKFVKETDWFRAYRDVVEHALKTAE